MPRVFLSPSLQEYNSYVNGGNEEYYMNLIVDEMIPYLKANNIDYVRNNPESSLSQTIQQSNEGNYDLHVAIHSNASPASTAGQAQGTDVYYFPSSENGKRLADLVVEEFKQIYPKPELVKEVSTTKLAEVKNTKAPSVLIETAFHDNVQDADWIRNNLNQIAKAISKSIAEYFNIPFQEYKSN